MFYIKVTVEGKIDTGMHNSKKFVTVLHGVQNGLYTSNMLPAQFIYTLSGNSAGSY